MLCSGRENAFKLAAVYHMVEQKQDPVAICSGVSAVEIELGRGATKKRVFMGLHTRLRRVPGRRKKIRCEAILYVMIQANVRGSGERPRRAAKRVRHEESKRPCCSIHSVLFKCFS